MKTDGGDRVASIWSRRVRSAALAVAAIGLAAGLFALSPQAALGQDRWTFEQTGGVSLATRDLGDADLGVGFGFHGAVAYRATGPVSVYGGWSWFRFHADDSFAGPNLRVDEVGVLYGLQVDQGLGPPPYPSLLARLGLSYQKVDLESTDGSPALESGFDAGWTAAVTVAFPLGAHWRIGPAFRYNAASPVFGEGVDRRSTDLRHLSAELAFSRRF